MAIDHPRVISEVTLRLFKPVLSEKSWSDWTWAEDDFYDFKQKKNEWRL